MAKPKVFVSYSSEDGEEVKNLVAFLHRLKVEVIIDRDFMRATNPIGEKLREQIRISDGCVWVLTENSLKSQWCPVELGAFWGAGKPVIIYSPSQMRFEPFSNIVHAHNYTHIEEAIERWELRGKTLAAVTVQDIEKLIKKNVSTATHGLSEEVRQLRHHLPVLTRMMDFIEAQNTYLESHSLLLSRITEILKRRRPKRLTCAFDVPGYGSVSAESDYLKCRDAFNNYVTEDEWDLTIFLLPADVGTEIVSTEYPQKIRNQKKAWGEDVRALRRFRRYAEYAQEGGRRNFKLGWLAVNRDANGAPSGLHSMPLNIWIFDGSEAVFSTVINNYKPTNSTEAGSPIKEIGFSTTDPDMVRFLGEIIKKYESNVDDTITLEDQIAASEKAKSRIEGSMSAQDKTSDTGE